LCTHYSCVFTSSFTNAEAKEEYVKRFVQGTTGLATWSNCKEKVQRPVDYTCRDDGPLSPSLTQKLPPLDIAGDETAQLGYMPQRDDYEKEFDNDAEKLVSQLGMYLLFSKRIHFIYYVSYIHIYLVFLCVLLFLYTKLIVCFL